MADSRQADYHREIRNLLNTRVHAILWVGVIFYPLFSILDFVVARQHFDLFVAYRLGFSLFCLLALCFLRFPVGRRQVFLVSLVAYLTGGATISMMIVRLGGYGSSYYVGILMVLVTYIVMLPLTVRQAIVSGALLYGLYVVPILIFNRPTTAGLDLFFAYNFFFIFLYVISVLQCSAENTARKREFALRTELKDVNNQLSYHAQNLEAEVDKRALALEESELRYRELYENIVDMVLLVDHHGRILKANPRFYETLGSENGSNSRTTVFRDVLLPDDAHRVENQLQACLEVGKDLKGLQFRVNARQGEVLDVECNARPIGGKDQNVGMQMVIRDISKRKKLERELRSSYENLRQARSATILGLAKLAEFRDRGTGKHLERICHYTRILAKELAHRPAYLGYITPQYLDDISLSSILHDIGKVGVPDAILLKPNRLTSAEFEVVKRHCILGGDVLEAAESQVRGPSFLTIGKAIAYHHHEKWDGTGYPSGLAGETIPLSTRIVALADVYDALTSRRSYKPAFSHEESVAIIVREKGRHFAPDVVEAFLSHEKEFNAARSEMQDHLETPPEPHYMSQR
ncbi:MAG: HD domain-containing phosphohydrolase [Desulfobacterales bacterium]